MRRQDHQRGRTRDRRHWKIATDAALIAFGVACALLVASDGGPVWRVARLAIVSTVVAGAWSAQRRRGWLAGCAACGLGLVGTAIGLGIALPHAVKAGIVPGTVLGVACLAAGLVLVVAGAAQLVHLVHSWRKAFVGLGVLIAGYVLIPSVAVAVAATNVPRTPFGPGTPADFGLAYEDVRFPARDGVSLSGWYLRSTNGRAVAVLHGAGSTRTAVLEHAVVLARHDYGVLLFDARGHGRSAGRAMDLGWQGDEDIGGAVDFLVAQPDVSKRISVLGVSMGGEEAIGAAATDGRIAAVVAEGATGRVAADRGWLSRELGMRGWIQERLDGLTDLTADLLTAAEPPVSLRAAAARMAPRPLLLITAGEVPDEGRAAAFIADAANSKVHVWTVDGASHGGARRAQPDAWEERVVGFIDDALR